MGSGQIVILNGAPRAGKSSIVQVIQDTFDGAWMNLGVDVARQATPPQYQPGIGLRPGEARHPAAPMVPLLYAAWYESIGLIAGSDSTSSPTSSTTILRSSRAALDASAACRPCSSASAVRST